MRCEKLNEFVHIQIDQNYYQVHITGKVEKHQIHLLFVFFGIKIDFDGLDNYDTWNYFVICIFSEVFSSF